MWKPTVNFLVVHYAWIISLSILSLVIIYPYGNMKAIDAFFFGASASTESGLNTIDLKELKTYQQVYVYLIPILGNLGFVNIIVVIVRLHWFEKHLRAVSSSLLKPEAPKGRNASFDVEATADKKQGLHNKRHPESRYDTSGDKPKESVLGSENQIDPEYNPTETEQEHISHTASPLATRTIQFGDETPEYDGQTKALYIPPPWKRSPIVEIENETNDCDDAVSTKLKPTDSNIPGPSYFQRTTSNMKSTTRQLERVVSIMFRPGGSASFDTSSRQRSTQEKPTYKALALPNISSQASMGRNSQFYNLTTEDRERLGGIEYRSLKLLLKIVTAYFIGIHLFGAICLVGWIQHADPKYREYLAECGQDNVWWGFYSAQTMVSNLGFTLTPDSMIHFQDATFPLIVMSFLAYAGNTCYPCLLRLAIWIMYKLCPEKSSMKETLSFLLDHPRRCYTLLFPSRPTWILFGILFTMNFVDVVLIIVLDLNNPAVNNLPAGPRVLAAIFQSASSRHTGTAIFNLAEVSPAVQFSLVVMMYVAVFPIAISVRASNIYEETTLGVYTKENDVDERNGQSYIMAHIQNQLTFDLWYIFIGVFFICIAEAGKISDNSIPAFSVFSVFFEVVSAYGNVGLSLGYPTVSTSLSGEFTVFSKLVVCAMMIRGRHRGLPYKLDRAIVLPRERLVEDDTEEDPNRRGRQFRQISGIKRYHTN
ncbi:hypothetical protein N7499_000841 [Penicillium canescens]|uniref:Potassium transport protein n=1 Tax=Penicillium canescens TaxID=5083 RepID=A0AAD6NB62_PENCN|nr:hypothetical protein N7522_005528 [Penicillium canescens]KAJ6029694.1 hypothetical protein N7444_012681 [Penicillium canescens]KAJ6048126.1 hypothetical protein N7460_004273 [Penicillium canescens]KAJ6101211.1 hypothetical protein N7499_000841 [Penicillium canescens]KAJ6173669.1 hypothetical protein N7485_006481 [Penicillium canescens]